MNARDAKKIAAEAQAKQEAIDKKDKLEAEEHRKRWDEAKPHRVKLELDRITSLIEKEAKEGKTSLEYPNVGYPEVIPLLRKLGYYVKTRTEQVDDVECYTDAQGQAFRKTGGRSNETTLIIKW